MIPVRVIAGWPVRGSPRDAAMTGLELDGYVRWRWWSKSLLALAPLSTATPTNLPSPSRGVSETPCSELFEFALEVLLEIGVAAEADIGELAALGIALAGGFAVFLA